MENYRPSLLGEGFSQKPFPMMQLSFRTKNTDWIPVFKKNDRKNVENYRPVSILPNLSKIYEKVPLQLSVQIFQYVSQNGNVHSVKAL